MLLGVVIEFYRLQIYTFSHKAISYSQKGKDTKNGIFLIFKVKINIRDYCYFPQSTVNNIIKVREMNKSQHFVFKIKMLELSTRSILNNSINNHKNLSIIFELNL